VNNKEVMQSYVEHAQNMSTAEEDARLQRIEEAEERSLRLD
jgi:hypothetical protein